MQGLKKMGFDRLLFLVEAAEPSRQQELLQLLAQEDPGWALLIQRKMLTHTNILHWPKSVLSEIIPQIPPALVLALFHSVDETLKIKIKQSVPSEWQAKFEPLAGEPQEGHSSQAAAIALVVITRDLICQNLLDTSLLPETHKIDRRLIA